MCVICIHTSVFQGYSLTKDEAIVIGKNSPLVQNLLVNSDKYSVEAFYLNATEVNSAISQNPELQQKYPENASIWVVMWDIHPSGGASAVAYLVDQVIDDVTGKILYEDTAGLR